MQTYFPLFSWRKTSDRLFMSQSHVQPWGVLLISMANNMTYESKGDIHLPPFLPPSPSVSLPLPLPFSLSLSVPLPPPALWDGQQKPPPRTHLPAMIWLPGACSSTASPVSLSELNYTESESCNYVSRFDPALGRQFEVAQRWTRANPHTVNHHAESPTGHFSARSLPEIPSTCCKMTNIKIATTSRCQSVFTVGNAVLFIFWCPLSYRVSNLGHWYCTAQEKRALKSHLT